MSVYLSAAAEAEVLGERGGAIAPPPMLFLASY